MLKSRADVLLLVVSFLCYGDRRVIMQVHFLGVFELLGSSVGGTQDLVLSLHRSASDVDMD